jgi:hypothetical protein
MKNNYSSILRRLWLGVGVISLLLPIFLPSLAGSGNLAHNGILVVNILMFALSLPASLVGIPVVVAASHYLDMTPDSIEGMYLNTILFFVLGFVQWFWLARIWSPSEAPLRMFDLAGDN